MRALVWLAGACPVRGIGPRPESRYREGARAQLHPLPPARTLPSAGEYLSPEALLLEGFFVGGNVRQRARRRRFQGHGGPLLGPPGHGSRSGLAPGAPAVPDDPLRPLVHDGRRPRPRGDDQLVDHPARVRPLVGRARRALAPARRASRSPGSASPSPRSRRAMRSSWSGVLASGLGVAAYHPEGSKFASYVSGRPPRQRHVALLGGRQHRLRARPAPRVVLRDHPRAWVGRRASSSRSPGWSWRRCSSSRFLTSRASRRRRSSRRAARRPQRTTGAAPAAPRHRRSPQPRAHGPLHLHPALRDLARAGARRTGRGCSRSSSSRARSAPCSAGRSPTASAGAASCSAASSPRRRSSSSTCSSAGPAGVVALFFAGMAVIGTFSVSLVMSQEYIPSRVGMASGLSIGLAIGLGGIAAVAPGRGRRRGRPRDRRPARRRSGPRSASSSRFSCPASRTVRTAEPAAAPTASLLMAETAQEFFDDLAARTAGGSERARGLTASYRFDVEGAGSWRVDVDDGAVAVSESDGAADCVSRPRRSSSCASSAASRARWAPSSWGRSASRATSGWRCASRTSWASRPTVGARAPARRPPGRAPARRASTITSSKGSSSSRRSAGSARSSCHGVAQTRSSPPGAVRASAKTRARCSGSQSGVSLRPRPS